MSLDQRSVMSLDQRHSTSTLMLAAGAALAVGTVLGAVMSARAVQSRLGRAKKRTLELLRLSKIPDGALSPASSSGAAAASAEAVKLAVVVRADAELPPSELIREAAATVLGQFKKLYKRKDPLLRAWEASGARIVALSAVGEAEMTAAQAAARARALPTHTFAGARGAAVAGQGKARSLMVIGPAEREALAAATAGLEALR